MKDLENPTEWFSLIGKGVISLFFSMLLSSEFDSVSEFLVCRKIFFLFLFFCCCCFSCFVCC